MIHARGVIVAAATCLAATVAVVPAASAEELVHQDFRHDVRWGEDDMAPHMRDPDILRVRVGHRDRAVVVREFDGFVVPSQSCPGRSESP